MSTSRLIDVISVKKGYPPFQLDITCAFFHAEEDGECYVAPPAAPQRRLQHVAVWMKSKDFQQREGLPCFFCLH